MGNIKVEVTSTLDQGAGDESWGIGEVEFMSEPADPTGLWSTNCEAATIKEAEDGTEYVGGMGECGRAD
jgi:hypothetical protein